jgi:hypothetical protein
VVLELWNWGFLWGLDVGAWNFAAPDGGKNLPNKRLPKSGCLTRELN